MIDIPVLQISSCVRCKTSLLGNPKAHLDICNQLERFDQASAQLYRMGDESLSLDQIGLLVEMLLTSQLDGYDIADIVANKTQPLTDEQHRKGYEEHGIGYCPACLSPDCYGFVCEKGDSI